MIDRVKIITFKSADPASLAEEINNFSKVKNVIATQTHYANDIWVAFCYYKK